MKKIAAIICSNPNSVRIPNKPFKLLNGKPLLEHLLNRLSTDVILAVSDKDSYSYLGEKMFEGLKDDPLSRMYHAAVMYNVDTIIRICNDKLFIDNDLIELALERFQKDSLDYLYSSKFTAGSGFEIISKDALERASKKFKNVEHISYAIRNITTNTLDFIPPDEYQSSYRFLIDYPEDIDLIESLLSQLGNDCSLLDVIKYMDQHPYLKSINQLPKFTVYTCIYNAEKFLERTINSVIDQTVFTQSEYLLIDDFSSDKSTEIISLYRSNFNNIKFIRNSKNIGLSASSNIALMRAKGENIIRLDADDYFTDSNSIETLANQKLKYNLDAIYPANYFGDLNIIQDGSDQHHVGGALFSTRAMNYLKFSDMLRGYEGLDFFNRAKDKLNIGYYDKPTFFYRQHNESLSKNNLEERKKIYNSLMN